MEESGSPLQWDEDQEDGSQSVCVRLRHFVSGRLLQVQLIKDRRCISKLLTLAQGSLGELERDGNGVSSKKILRNSDRIQNYVFKLTNRATVDEPILTRDTVANISNVGTNTFISTEIKNLEDSEELDEGLDNEEDCADDETVDENADCSG